MALSTPISSKTFLGPCGEGRASRVLERFLHSHGGSAEASLLKGLYDDNPWLGGAIGTLKSFCATNAVINYTSGTKDTPARVYIVQDLVNLSQDEDNVAVSDFVGASEAESYC